MRKFKRRKNTNFLWFYIILILGEVISSINGLGKLISPKLINIVKNNILYYDNLLVEEYVDTKELRGNLVDNLISLDKNSKSLDYIASNIACNMLGMGSAATPFGLKAMASMQEENKNKDTASTAMITFLVLNTAGVTLIPTTTIALRMSHGSLNPTCIILPSIIATTVSSICGLTLEYFIRKKNKE